MPAKGAHNPANPPDAVLHGLRLACSLYEPKTDSPDKLARNCPGTPRGRGQQQQVRQMANNCLARSLGWIVCVLLAVSGCRPDAAGDMNCPPEDTNHSDEVRFLLRMTPVDPDFEERRQQALARLEGGVVHSEPILLFARVLRPVGYDPVNIGLIVVDQDRDLLGIGIREFVRDENGRSVVRLEERYPVFAHREWRYVMDVVQVPFSVRDADQRKNECCWKDYVQKAIDRISPVRWEHYRDTLPTVWVSLPKPGDLDVEVYVYDQAGHESDPVVLFDGSVGIGPPAWRKSAGNRSCFTERHYGAVSQNRWLGGVEEEQPLCACRSHRVCVIPATDSRL